jgi:hypothetical protein
MANVHAFIKKIPPIQYNDHLGKDTAGRITYSIMKTKTQSAILSKVAPKGELILYFLAIYPSSISLMPQKRYSAKKGLENGTTVNKKMEPMILKIVITFGINPISPPRKHIINPRLA